MSPIKGLSEQRRLPRLGKIRLGIKKTNKSGVEYPAAVDYFVCPLEVQEIYGKEPRKLDVIIPLEDEEIWANQYYRQYSRTRGLVCKGDGETCRRMVDIDTGNVAGRETKRVAWIEGGKCAGKECPDYKSKACQEVMNLQFLLPKVPGLGVWQIDTGSIHSIRNINDCATMIRAMTPNGRVSWVSLVLSLEPITITNPEDGKKKTVHCMALRYEGTAESLIRDSDKPRLQLLISNPVDNEAPDDQENSTLKSEKPDETQGKAASEIIDMYPKTEKGEKQTKTTEDPEWDKLKRESSQQEVKPPPEATKSQPDVDKPGAGVVDGKPVNKDGLLTMVAEAKGWKNTKSVMSWLTTVCKITESRITSEPAKVWEEVRQLI